MKRLFLSLCFCFIVSIIFGAVKHNGSAILGVKSDGTLANIKVDENENISISSNVVINTIDNTYNNKTSSTTVGRLTATNTVNVSYAVKEVSILTKGLESSTTSNYWGGTLYIPDGVSSTILFDVPISTNFTITTTLGANSTMYYIIRGAK